MGRHPAMIGRDRAPARGALPVALAVSLILCALAAWVPRAGAGAPADPGRSGPFGTGNGPAIGDDRPEMQGRAAEFRDAQLGQVTPDKLERWRHLPPDERERIKERYRRWKELPPERRERILERQRRWRELPESERRFLRERREIYRSAWPEEKRVIRKFVRRWRELPPARRQALRQRFLEWRDLPAAERDERMMDWRFYAQLSPEERKVINRFLFSEPPSAAPQAPRGREPSPPPGPGGSSMPPGPPRD